jgi:DNA-binding response OmpR family regulator
MTAPIVPARRILVVDDEPLVCDSVKRMLAFYGHDVQGVNSGEEALALLDQTRFDLVIIDHFMPRMPGDELAAIIKSRTPGQPILIITAAVERLQSFTGTTRDKDFIVGKPFQMQELNEAINRVLAEKSPAG